MDKQDIHNTRREIDYLMAIGSEHLNTKKIPRHEMLERYIKAAEKRVNWDGMSKDKILKFSEGLV